MQNNTCASPSDSAQTRLGAVSPVERVIFKDSIEDTIQQIWKRVASFYEGSNKGFGEIKFVNRLQYVEDKAKVYRFEMGVQIDRDDIGHLVRHCPTVSDIDAYFRLLYDYTYFPDRVKLGPDSKKIRIKKGVIV